MEGGVAVWTLIRRRADGGVRQQEGCLCVRVHRGSWALLGCGGEPGQGQLVLFLAADSKYETGLAWPFCIWICEMGYVSDETFWQWRPYVRQRVAFKTSPPVPASFLGYFFLSFFFQGYRNVASAARILIPKIPKPHGVTEL